ncbi:hypothetical protein B0H13DRAFT_2430152 [Mycena leptocephala]|nr:hypothetical protein B0H13DRAFT_2430152 [Mycena leptocephala]
MVLTMTFHIVHAIAAFALLIIPAVMALPPPACNCGGTNFTDSQFLCGDVRLGPDTLPTNGPLAPLLIHYDRLGGLCPGDFLAKWTFPNGSYEFPPFEGFQLSTSEMPIDGNQLLLPGMRLDRFGSNFGMFMAPADTPFSQRSLPPSSLSSAYHVYEVQQELTVLSGEIAGWFSQPGQGTQYFVNVTIQSLLDAGVLEEVEA